VAGTDLDAGEVQGEESVLGGGQFGISLNDHPQEGGAVAVVVQAQGGPQGGKSPGGNWDSGKRARGGSVGLPGRPGVGPRSRRGRGGRSPDRAERRQGPGPVAPGEWRGCPRPSRERRRRRLAPSRRSRSAQPGRPRRRRDRRRFSPHPAARSWISWSFSGDGMRCDRANPSFELRGTARVAFSFRYRAQSSALQSVSWPPPREGAGNSLDTRGGPG
jgi:hypothetical protein